MSLFSEYYIYSLLEEYTREELQDRVDGSIQKLQELINKQLNQEIDKIERRLDSIKSAKQNLDSGKAREDLIQERKDSIKIDIENARKMLNKLKDIAKRKNQKFDFEPFEKRLNEIEGKVK
jgi:LPS O-antigen subunit length determinant protein (WzzB/FepE family)